MSRKENVQVFTRFRPENSRERKTGTRRCMVFPSDTVVETDNPPERTLKFRFDHVFNPESTQDAVYNIIGASLMTEVFKGFNATVFAYGQTGSGKTHTMMGVASDPVLKGIIPRLVEDLFTSIENADSNLQFTVKISYVEIYMEQINDLLDLSKRNLKLRENRKKETYIEGVSEVWVTNVEDVYIYMEEGTSNRSIAQTKMNAASSRSHSVFLMTLGQKNKEKGSKKSSKLILVDLAGSEKVGKTEASGQTLDEAKYINRSLTLLGVVISALTKGAKHIPYRDSKLTRMLSNSLGGNSRTRLIVTASPSPFNYDETVSTLRFGVRAKEIKNRARVNQEMSAAEYKRLYFEAKKKLKEQKVIIGKLKKDLSEKYNGEYVEPVIVRTRTPSIGMRDDNPEIMETADGSHDVNYSPAMIGGGIIGNDAVEYKKLQDEYTQKLKDWDEQARKETALREQMHEDLLEKEAQINEQNNKLLENQEYLNEIKKQLREAENKDKEFQLFKIEAESKENQGKCLAEQMKMQIELKHQETLRITGDFQQKCQEALEYKMLAEESRAASPAPPKKSSWLGNKDSGNSEKEAKLFAENSALKERILFLSQILESKDNQVKYLREARDKSLEINRKLTETSNAETEALQEQVEKFRTVLSTMFERVKHDPDKRNSYRRRASFSHHRSRRAANSSHNIVMPISGGGGRKSLNNMDDITHNMDEIDPSPFMEDTL